MFYFPVIWVICILSHVYFLIKLKKTESDYKIALEKHPGNMQPKIKSLKSLIRTTVDRKLKKDLQLLLFLRLIL